MLRPFLCLNLYSLGPIWFLVANFFIVSILRPKNIKTQLWGHFWGQKKDSHFCKSLHCKVICYYSLCRLHTYNMHMQTQDTVFGNITYEGMTKGVACSCVYIWGHFGDRASNQTLRTTYGGRPCRGRNEALTTGTILTHHQKRSPAPSRMVTSSQSLNESNPAVIGFNA